MHLAVTTSVQHSYAVHWLCKTANVDSTLPQSKLAGHCGNAFSTAKGQCVQHSSISLTCMRFWALGTDIWHCRMLQQRPYPSCQDQTLPAPCLGLDQPLALAVAPCRAPAYALGLALDSASCQQKAEPQGYCWDRDWGHWVMCHKPPAAAPGYISYASQHAHLLQAVQQLYAWPACSQSAAVLQQVLACLLSAAVLSLVSAWLLAVAAQQS